MQAICHQGTIAGPDTDVVGVVFWLLYGLMRLSGYYGSDIDPVLRHWLIFAGGAFGVVGFIFRERLGDAIGDALSIIFHFEINERPEKQVSFLGGLAFLTIILTAIWFSVPT